MSTAAPVDLSIDRGADFGVQIYWMDPVLTPYTVLSPVKMEIRSDDGELRLVHTCSDADEGITFSSTNGLIQIIIDADVTASFQPGSYVYDLFATYQQDPTTTRLRRVVKGHVFVEERVTRV
jgi:hypothetical protein